MWILNTTPGSLTNVNHDEDYRYHRGTQTHTDEENHIDGILKHVWDFKSTAREEPQGVDEIKFCEETIGKTTHIDDESYNNDVQKHLVGTYFIAGEEFFIVPGQFDDPPEEGDDANDEDIKLLVGDEDNHKSDKDDDDDGNFTVSTNFEVDEYDGDDTITGADFPKMDERQNDETTWLCAEIKRLQHLLQEATTQQLMMEYFKV